MRGFGRPISPLIKYASHVTQRHRLKQHGDAQSWLKQRLYGPRLTRQDKLPRKCLRPVGGHASSRGRRFKTELT